MLVTLKQSMLLVQEYANGMITQVQSILQSSPSSPQQQSLTISPFAVTHLRDIFRAYGVRLQNTKKNTGVVCLFLIELTEYSQNICLIRSK